WGNGHGRGALDKRSARWPLHGPGAVDSELGWRQPAELRMWALSVVVSLPRRQLHPGVGQRGEQHFVQQLVPQAPVEALDEGVLGWLTRGDVVPFDAGILRPLEDRHAGELSAVVRDQAQRSPALGDDGIQLAGDPGSG